MATKRLSATADAAATSDTADAPKMVTLRSENLGKTKDFTPKHAQDLLDLQQAKGITNGWAPAEPETPTDNA